MATKVKVNWYPGAQKQILKSCNMITYGIARQTLDLTYSHIPKDTGKMRQTSMSAGVRGSNGKYYIGSYTDYAMYVWLKPKGTHWSEPDTFGKWYEVIWKKSKTSIIENCTRRYGLK